MKLNIGCGKDIKKGYINCDKEYNKRINKIIDLEKNGLKEFKNNSIEEILLYGVLEHTNNPIETINECHRILKENGKLKIKVPHYKSPYAYMPQHKTFYSYKWFEWGLEEEWNEIKEYSKFETSLTWFDYKPYKIKIKGKLAGLMDWIFPIMAGIECELIKWILENS